MLGGIVPLACIASDLSTVMSDADVCYNLDATMASFPLAMFLALSCIPVSMFMTFLQLRAGNHRWWWSSFMNTASVGLYVLSYVVMLIAFRYIYQGFPWVSALLAVDVFSFLVPTCFGLGVMCGSVGMLSSLWFTRTIYGATTSSVGSEGDNITSATREV